MIKYLLLILPIFSLAQEAVRVEYEARQEFDRSKVEKTSAKANELFKNSEDKRYYFESLVNNKNSFFKEIERINNTPHVASFGLSPNVSSTIFKDFETKELYERNIMMPKAFVKDSIQTFPWVLTKVEKIILGYKVRKAIYENNNQMVEAWYALDLPFRDGPSRFNGLPGLILEISFKVPFAVDMDSNVIFTAIDLKPYQGIIELPKKSSIVAKDEYQKELDKKTTKLKSITPQGVDRD